MPLHASHGAPCQDESGFVGRVLQTSVTRLEWIWLAVIFLLGLGLRLFRLGNQAVWVDEMCRVVWAKGYGFPGLFEGLPSTTVTRLPIRSFEIALSEINQHNPPLNGILLHGWMRLVGFESDFLVRLPFAIFGALSVVMVFFAVREKWNGRISLLTALLVACAPFHIYYSQEINHYSTAFFFVSCTFFFYLRMLDDDGFWIRVGYAVVGTLALFTHYYCAIVMFFQAVSLIVHKRSRLLAFWRDAVAYLSIAAAFSWYLPVVRQQMRELTSPVGPDTGVGYVVAKLSNFLVRTLMADRTDMMENNIYLPTLCVICAVLVFGFVLTSGRRLRMLLVFNLVGPLLLLSLCCSLLHQSSMLWPRYLLFFTLALFIPMATFFSTFRWYKLPFIVSFIGLIAWGNYFQYFQLAKEDWHGTTRAILSEGTSEDTILVHEAILGNTLARYLYTDNRIFGVYANPKIDEQLERASRSKSGVWFVVLWAGGDGFVERVHAYLGSKYATRTGFPVVAGSVRLSVTRYSQLRVAQ